MNIEQCTVHTLQIGKDLQASKHCSKVTLKGKKSPMNNLFCSKQPLCDPPPKEVLIKIENVNKISFISN